MPGRGPEPGKSSVYLLGYFFFDKAALGPHQVWILSLFFILAVIFSVAALVNRDESGRRDLVLIIVAPFLWGLFSSGSLITLEYEYGFKVPPPIRHLSLIIIEIPLYALVVVLLKDNIRTFLRNRLRWLLDD
jgi:hypothetical protein